MFTNANAQPISFSDAWQVLQQKNNSIAAQKANVDRYKQKEKASDSLNYPTVTLGATYTRLDKDVTLSGSDLVESLDANSAASISHLLTSLSGMGFSISGDPTSTIAERDIFNSSVRAVWPIYTGGRISSAQQIASGQTDEARANLAMETMQRYRDLARYYFSVVLAESVVETRKKVEKGLSKHLEFAEKLQQQGQIAKVERLQAEASLDHAVVQRKSAEKDLEIAQSALTEILNQQSMVSPDTNLFVNATLPPLDLFIDQTLATYPGLDLLAAKEKQANNLIKVEKGAYYPEVYLYGNYTLYEGEELANKMTPDWLVGVGVNIPLIDNSGRGENVQAAKSTLLQVNHLKAQANQDLTVLVKKTYFQAEQAQQEVTGLESSLTLAQENLKLRSKAFSQGLSTSLDVVDAELYMAQIETQQLVAKFNYLIALNGLLAMSGQMDTFQNYSIDANLNSNNKEKL
ncbi:TolC family protein [Vibrio hannami]|uniref:TolC family protein n=1 Tax=Vibrio hannami TaxID=2717094 RepID=UPI00240ECEE2|nr:TolC family protein [Vibrio hannami]MDG3088165.1 TolC family protein [Vibrio hannami]